MSGAEASHSGLLVLQRAGEEESSALGLLAGSEEDDGVRRWTVLAPDTSK